MTLSMYMGMQERQKVKQRLESSMKAEDELKEQVIAQQKLVDDANLHCKALQKAREEAEDELQVSSLPLIPMCPVYAGVQGLGLSSVIMRFT